MLCELGWVFSVTVRDQKLAVPNDILGSPVLTYSVCGHHTEGFSSFSS